MAALFGAVALGSCDSGKSDEELCPGADRIEAIKGGSDKGGCCDDKNYNGLCDEIESPFQEDVSEPGLDTLVGDTSVGPDTPSIEDTIEPYIPPANCMICDEFLNPSYTEQNWGITKIRPGASYDISEGLLTSRDYEFDFLGEFDSNQNFSFEIRYKLEQPDSQFFIQVYRLEDNKEVLTFEINKAGSNEIVLNPGIPSGYLNPSGWHTLRVDSTAQETGSMKKGTLFSVDGKEPFLDFPFPHAFGPLGVSFFAEQGAVSVDYMEIKKPL